MLTPAQLQTIKAWIIANRGSAFDQGAVDALNSVATPVYNVWRPAITRSEVYHEASDSGTTWNWATYKAQGATEQNAWTQMFMGDEGPIGNQNFRAGVLAIFSGAGAPATQRAHVFAIGRRAATVAEKLLATPVINPPANTGNDTGQPRGSAANPDNLGLTGDVTLDDVIASEAS